MAAAGADVADDLTIDHSDVSRAIAAGAEYLAAQPAGRLIDHLLADGTP